MDTDYVYSTSLGLCVGQCLQILFNWKFFPNKSGATGRSIQTERKTFARVLQKREQD